MARKVWKNVTNKAQTFKEKGAKFMNSVQKNPNVKGAISTAKKHPKETILAILMILGLVFSGYAIGSFVVGLAGALYAPWTIKEVWDRGARFFKSEGKFPSLMLGLAILFLLLHVTWFIIGGIVGLAVKVLFQKGH